MAVTNACIAQFTTKWAGKIDNDIMDEMIESVKKNEEPKQILNKMKERVNKQIDNHPLKQKHFNEIDKAIKGTKTSKEAFEHLESRVISSPGKGSPHFNVETLKASFRDSVFHKHFETLNSLRNKLFGNKVQKDLLYKLARYDFDGLADIEAKQLKAEFNVINDAMYDLYKQSGGTKPKLSTMLSNDADTILTMPRDEFIENVTPLVNNPKEALETLYDNALKGIDIANDKLDFGSADKYMEYNALFGTNAWTSFMNNLEKMATETAMNKIFGPNSDATIRKLMSENKFNKEQQDRINGLVNAIMGHTNTPVNQKMAKIGKGGRSLTTASMLGGAVFSAVGDLSTMLVSAHFNDMPLIKTMLSGIAGLGKIKHNEELLARLGFVSDDIIDGLNNSFRYDPNAAGTDMLSKSTDKVLRASGLIAWTTAEKNAWTLSLLGNVAEQTQKYKTIPKKMKKQMDAYGITQKDWTEIRKQKGEFLDVTQLPDELNFKMRQYIREETSYAVLEPGAGIQEFMSMGTHAGTVKGEAVRSVGQFKSFLVAGYFTHIKRLLKLGTALEKAEYFASMLVAGTAIGMLVVALKDVKDGNNPLSRKYDEPEAYMKALEESGMLGPLGEFFKPTQFGSSPLDIISPASAPILSLLKPGMALASDKDVEERFADMARAVAKLVPGRNLWETQHLTNTIGRKMMILAYPEYQKTFDRIDKAAKTKEAKSNLEPINFFE